MFGGMPSPEAKQIGCLGYSKLKSVKGRKHNSVLTNKRLYQLILLKDCGPRPLHEEACRAVNVEALRSQLCAQQMHMEVVLHPAPFGDSTCTARSCCSCKAVLHHGVSQLTDKPKDFDRAASTATDVSCSRS